MSIEINWDTLTSGPEGQQRADRIRAFIHDKFQNLPRPKFIQSIKVVSFDFGSVAPDVEIRDICDPFPEFYEDEYDEDNEEGEEAGRALSEEEVRRRDRERRRRERKAAEEAGEVGSQAGGSTGTQPPPYIDTTPGPPTRPPLPGFRSSFSPVVGGDTLRGVSTPLFPLHGAPATGSLHYFHSALSGGFPGTSTPLTGAGLGFPSTPGSPLSHSIRPSPFHIPTTPYLPPTYDSRPPPSPTSEDGIAEPPSTPTNPRPTTPQTPPPTSPPARLHLREPRDTDLQLVAHVRYAGNMRLEITCELLLDYPAVSFLALPVRLVISGFAFEGEMVVAMIRRVVHVAFLEPEAGDAAPSDSVLGSPGGRHGAGAAGAGGAGWGVGGGMLKEIKVESEIGEKGKGKQVLKNVGKVERFVLEQVRRIFEDEFVFPSTWSFLI